MLPVFLGVATVGAVALLYVRSKSNSGNVDSPDPASVFDFVPSFGTESIPIYADETTGEQVSANAPSDAAIAALKVIEGFSSTPYADPPGQSKTFSIGYGYQIRNGESFPNGVSYAEADALMQKVVNEVTDCINSSVTVPLTPNQYDALFLFIYNIGQTKFKSSTLLKMLNAGDYEGARLQFARWNKANGQVNQSLVARRESEAALFNA